MTEDEIMSLWNEHADGMNGDTLMRFANAVAAKEREEANARANALWTLMCKKMVAFEREACAKMCEGGNFLHDEAPDARLGKACAAAIRARGEQT